MNRVLAFSLLLASPALAQSPTLVQQAANSGDGLAALTVTLSQPPTIGNVLIVCHDSTSGSNSMVSGGGVSQWTLCQSTIPVDNSEVWAGVVDNVSSGTLIKLGGSPNSASAIVTEWRGLKIPLAFTGAGANYRSDVAATPAIQADAGDLVMAMVGTHSFGQVITSATPGYTDLEAPPTTSSSLMAAAFQVAPASGLTGMTWSFAYPSNWATAIVVFEPAPVVPPPGLVQQGAISKDDVRSLNLDLARAPARGNLVVVCIDSTANASTVRGGGVSNWRLAQASNSLNLLVLRTRSEVWFGVVDGTASKRITVEGDLRRNSISMIASEWTRTAPEPFSDGASLSGSGGTLVDPATTQPLPVSTNDLVIATAGVADGSSRFSPASGGFTNLVAPKVRARCGIAAAYLVPNSNSVAETRWTLSKPTFWASCIVRIHR